MASAPIAVVSGKKATSTSLKSNSNGQLQGHFSKAKDANRSNKQTEKGVTIFANVNIANTKSKRVLGFLKFGRSKEAKPVEEKQKITTSNKLQTDDSNGETTDENKRSKFNKDLPLTSSNNTIKPSPVALIKTSTATELKVTVLNSTASTSASADVPTTSVHMLGNHSSSQSDNHHQQEHNKDHSNFTNITTTSSSDRDHCDDHKDNSNQQHHNSNNSHHESPGESADEDEVDEDDLVEEEEESMSALSRALIDPPTQFQSSTQKESAAGGSGNGEMLGKSSISGLKDNTTAGLSNRHYNSTTAALLTNFLLNNASTFGNGSLQGDIGPSSSAGNGALVSPSNLANYMDYTFPRGHGARARTRGHHSLHSQRHLQDQMLISGKYEKNSLFYY